MYDAHPVIFFKSFEYMWSNVIYIFVSVQFCALWIYNSESLHRTEIILGISVDPHEEYTVTISLYMYLYSHFMYCVYNSI
jgi:hypothetical protein